MVRKDEVVKELAQIINANSMENASNTPDFILAEYLYDCWEAFNKSCNARTKWYIGTAEPGVAEHGTPHGE